MNRSISTPTSVYQGLISTADCPSTVGVGSRLVSGGGGVTSTAGLVAVLDRSSVYGEGWAVSATVISFSAGQTLTVSVYATCTVP